MSGEDFVVSSLFHSPEAGGIPSDLSCFLNRCFIARVRCLLDSTSGFLVGILTHSAVRQIPDRVRFPPNTDLSFLQVTSFNVSWVQVFKVCCQVWANFLTGGATVGPRGAE